MKTRKVLYNPAFHPQEFTRLIKQGKLLTDIAAEWHVVGYTVYTWSKRYPEFGHVYKCHKSYKEEAVRVIVEGSCVNKVFKQFETLNESDKRKVLSLIFKSRPPLSLLDKS